MFLSGARPPHWRIPICMSTHYTLRIHSVYTPYTLSIHSVYTQYTLSIHSVYLDTWSGIEAANARATLDKQSCVITSTLFETNSTCMRWCDLNFSCLSTSITSPEVSSCQNKRRYPNPTWPTVFTFRAFKLSFCEFMTMVSLHLHKSN